MVEENKIVNINSQTTKSLSNDELVGLKVKHARNMAGISMVALGEKLGLTFQQIQKYEKGTNRISAGTLSRIAVILNQPIQFFFEDIASGNSSAPKEYEKCSEDEASLVLDNYKEIKKYSTRLSLRKIIEELKN